MAASAIIPPTPLPLIKTPFYSPPFSTSATMAKATLICMLLLSTLFLHQPAESCCRGATMLELHRQLLLEMKNKMDLKNGVPKLAANGNHDMELRRVPSGPDPLHHNGRDPNKPRTP